MGVGGKSGSRKGTRTRVGVTFKPLPLVTYPPPIRPHLLKAPQPPQLGSKPSKQEPEGDSQIQTKAVFLPGGDGLLPPLPHSPLGKQQSSKETPSSGALTELLSAPGTPPVLFYAFLSPAHFTAVRSSTPAIPRRAPDPVICGGKKCLF